MYIKRICYPICTLGPGRRVGIWVSGCKKRCVGCMSPELQDMSYGYNYSVPDIIKIIKKIVGTIDGFSISGGEPFLQASELSDLVRTICQEYTDDIIVYSGYTMKELRDSEDPNVESVLHSISVLIDGPYVDELNDGIGIRGSSNQVIHIIRHAADYSNLGTQRRNLQCFRYENRLLLIGIQ